MKIIKLFLFYVLTLICSTQQQQSLDYSASGIFLDKEFAGCGITWSDQVTMITCLTSSYIYASEDFGQTKVKRVIVNGEVKMARRVMLSSGKSCVQYIINTNQVYQASLSSNSISNTFIYTIPIDPNDVFSPQIFGVQFSQTSALMYFENSTLALYTISKPQSSQMILNHQGQLNLPATEQKIFFLLNTSQFYYYLSSNRSINIYADLKFQYSINLQYKPTSISSSLYYTLIGCADCNSGRGRVEVYKEAVKVGEVNGDTNNMQMGTDIVALDESMFHVGSNSNDLMNKRQYFSNIVRIVDDTNGIVEIEQIKQAIKGVVNTPHGGLNVEKKSDGMLFKYSFHKGIYSANLCELSQFYQVSNRTCSSCKDQQFSLSLQSTVCQPCVNQQQNQTSFQKFLQNSQCTSQQTQVVVSSNVTLNSSVTPQSLSNSSIQNQSSQVVNQTTSNITNSTKQNQNASENQKSYQNNSSPTTVSNSSTQTNQTNSLNNATQNSTNKTNNFTTNNQTDIKSQKTIPNSTQANITVPIQTINDTNVTSNETLPNPIIVYGNNSISTNISTSQSDSRTNLTSPSSQANNGTITTSEGETNSSFNKTMMAIGIVVALLLIGIIAGVIRWLHVKRSQKFKMLRNQFKQEATINVGMPTNFDTTNIGQTVEDLKPRGTHETTAMDTQHSKSNSNVPFVEPQLPEIQNDFQEINPALETTFYQKDFDSAQIQREVQREVQHLRDLFMQGEQQHSSPNDDQFDIESKPATSDEQLQKAYAAHQNSQQVSKFSIDNYDKPVQKQKKRKERFFAELEQSVSGLQIETRNYKMSRTDKKREQLDYIKENQTPNSNFDDFKNAYGNLNSERTNLPGESRRSLIKKK